MHSIVMDFGKKHSGKLVGTILDVGSFNVNGTIRDVIPVTVGVDMREGPCVDKVMDATELLEEFGPESFDNVISNDALEHMQDWEGCLRNMWGVLRPGGYFLCTMANPKKGYHGYPHDYWRWPIERFKLLFGKNQVLDWFEGGPSMGVVLKKEHPLDLSIKPVPVVNK